MENKRILTLKRDKEMTGALAEFHLYVDGQDCGNIKNGEKKNFHITEEEHIVFIRASFSNGIQDSVEYIIPANRRNYFYHVIQEVDPFNFGSKIVLEIDLDEGVLCVNKSFE